jgi:hypothetical protein
MKTYLCALAMAGAVMASASQAQAYCRDTIRATGVGNVLPAIARHNAIRAWNREVRSVYGPGFSWSNTRNSRVECERVKLTVRCTAKARPCK